MKRKCSTCRFYDTKQYEGTAICRCMPPNASNEFLFPAVRESDWCGQWAPNGKVARESAEQVREWRKKQKSGELIQPGDFVVALANHSSVHMVQLKSGELYLVESVGDAEENGAYSVRIDNGLSYGNCWFRLATKDEIAKRLATVRGRLETLADSDTDAARYVWCGPAK